MFQSCINLATLPMSMWAHQYVVTSLEVKLTFYNSLMQHSSIVGSPLHEVYPGFPRDSATR